MDLAWPRALTYFHFTPLTDKMDSKSRIRSPTCILLEMSILMHVYFITAAIFLALGLMVHVFKWHFLIAGYNTMSREKKKNVDTEGLGRALGYYGYANAAVFLLTGILDAAGIKLGMTPAMVFFAVTTLVMLVRTQKYDGNLYDAQGQLRPGAGKKLAVSLGVMGITLAGVALLMLYLAQPIQVSFLEPGLQIRGMYGDTYAWGDIDEVSLEEKLPAIELRTNGSAVGDHLRGYFRTREYGSVKLFLDDREPPFIFMKVKGEIIILNRGSAAQTLDTYHNILTSRERAKGSQAGSEGAGSSSGGAGSGSGNGSGSAGGGGKS